ncbi:MAG: hypothetical protein HOE90_20820 [Bacteriovoracaceae bacterium]|jgi:hypothetical protein|nr:hypothetical protein [Bacteriovoracaceae bacterium]
MRLLLISLAFLIPYGSFAKPQIKANSNGKIHGKVKKRVRINTVCRLDDGQLTIKGLVQLGKKNKVISHGLKFKWKNSHGTKKTNVMKPGKKNGKTNFHAGILSNGVIYHFLYYPGLGKVTRSYVNTGGGGAAMSDVRCDQKYRSFLNK